MTATLVAVMALGSRNSGCPSHAGDVRAACTTPDEPEPDRTARWIDPVTSNWASATLLPGWELTFLGPAPAYVIWEYR